jgi:diguanylate cyclase (GGDEF)-like protein
VATADSLTGIANRRAFEEALDQEWRRTLRHRTPLCLILIDVDFFKRFNDAYGHVAGDHCLQQVAQALAGNARRAGEIAARYGGEEFAVLLPHTEVDDAHRLAQRMCEVVRQLAIPHRQSEVAPHVTISAGVASALLVLARDLPAEAERASPTLLIKAADQALYGAKAAGRNQVMSARAGDGSRRTDERQPAGDELPPDATPWGDAVRVL